jgi:hypothetical protein
MRTLKRQVSTSIAFYEEDAVPVLFKELEPLLEEHFKEVAHYQDIPLDPVWSIYAQAHGTGNLRVYTFREAGVLAGYAVFFVRSNIHYASSLQAVQDVIWLAPAYRKQMLGAAFIQFCDSELKHLGVQVVHHHVKLSLDWGETLKRMGYEAVETIYSKRLDRE